MVGETGSIQVLNISNVNAQGKTVLNDGKLLELIQKYPFLYNKRVKGYNDSDYTEWAWRNINAAFNCAYANDPTAAFSTHSLMSRWNALKPLIQCLSKAYDMEAIPQPLRNSVIKICTELDDKSCTTINKQNSSAQNLLLQNMSAIAELPMAKRLALEREVLNVILSTELESKQTIELKDADWKEINQDTEEFMNDIGYKQVLLNAISNRERIYYNNNCNRYSTYNQRRPRTLGWVPLSKAQKNIKPCRVRLQRINVEDYLPLSKIILMDKVRGQNFKPGRLKSEIISIFGI